MNRPYQLKELIAAYWLGCLTVLIQSYLVARYVPYNALPDEAANSLAAQLLRNNGRTAAFIAACASLLALSLAKQLIERRVRWRWSLPFIAANGWLLAFLSIFQNRVDSQRQMLTPLLTAIHPSLDVNLVFAVVLEAHGFSTIAFLGLQYFCLIIVQGFCQPIAVSSEDAET